MTELDQQLEKLDVTIAAIRAHIRRVDMIIDELRKEKPRVSEPPDTPSG